MKTKLKTIALYAISLILIAGLSFLIIKRPWVSSSGSSIKLLDYSDATNSFKVQYPEDFVIGKISPQDQSNKSDPVLFKLVRVDPPALILIWKESGLGVLDAFIKKPLLDFLRDNVDKRYSAAYNDFKKEKLENTKISGFDGFVVWFTFQDKTKDFREKIKLDVFVKDKAAYYIQCMAPVVEWSKAENFCDQVANSFTLAGK